MDGQQRLAAIRDFFADKVRVDGNIEPQRRADRRAKREEVFAAAGGRTQSCDNRFVLPVITLTDYDPQEPNELFFRLNQSYNLTPPEKRNALHGVARDQVRHLVNSLTTSGLLQSSMIGFSNGRLAYDDIVARTCVAIELGNLRQHINNNVVEDFLPH